MTTPWHSKSVGFSIGDVQYITNKAWLIWQALREESLVTNGISLPCTVAVMSEDRQPNGASPGPDDSAGMFPIETEEHAERVSLVV